MSNFKGWKLILVDHLIVSEHLFRAFARPIEILDGPMDEGALEGLVYVSPIDPCSCA